MGRQARSRHLERLVRDDTIWVTGAGGLLGQAIIRALSRVRPDAQLLTPSSAQLDLTKRDDTVRFVTERMPNTVIHAAGRVGGIAANVARPVDFLVDNMLIGMNLISVCRDLGVANFLNVSSSCVYPRDHLGPLTEDMVLTGSLEPTNEGYALAKIAADRLCDYIATHDGLNYRTIIPSNLYGPGDHFDDLRGHLVAHVIRKVHSAFVEGDPLVSVWGDGTARREFTFVDDVADFIAAASIAAMLGALPQRLNVGLGIDHSVTEYYEAVGRLIGFRGRFEYDTSKPSGMARKLMDSSLAGEHGWSPTTDLQSGLSLTYGYYLRLIG